MRGYLERAFPQRSKPDTDDLISELQPFETEIVFGTDYNTEVTIDYTPILNSETVNRNSGVAIAGVTDGYTGALPDRGAIITGLDTVTYGATVEEATLSTPISTGTMAIGAGTTPITVQ